MEHLLRKPTWKERVRGHLTGPVGSIVFHILLITAMIRFLTGDHETLVRQTPVELKLDNRPIEVEKIKEIKQIEVTEVLPDLNMNIPDTAFAMDVADVPTDNTPQATGDPIDLQDLALVSNVESLVSISGIVRGGGSSAGASFGYGSRVRGDLVGSMYDLKRNAKGQARSPHYLNDLRTIIAGGLSEKAFSDFYRVPNPLYATHLYFPRQSADNGPIAFGVGDKMKPSNWIVHYSGMMRSPEARRYRFVGMFDDLLMVFVDGKIAMEFLWTGDPTPWEPKDYVNQHMCFANRPLVYGDWLSLTPNQMHRVDILVGEHPGGMVGGVLLIEEEGKVYEKARDGRPILPVFAVQRLTYHERKVLEENTSWPFHFPVPNFNIAPSNEDITKKDASDIEIQL